MNLKKPSKEISLFVNSKEYESQINRYHLGVKASEYVITVVSSNPDKSKNMMYIGTSYKDNINHAIELMNKYINEYLSINGSVITFSEIRLIEK